MTATKPNRSSVRLGMVLMPTDPWAETVAAAQRLDRLGYDHLWMYDHFLWRRYRDRPWHAPYPLLAGLAASTGRIGLGTMVSNLNLRHPLTLAKDAMTIDHISTGRFTLGLGTGGTGFDATILGQAPLTPAQRVERLAEATELIDGLLRGEVTVHHGTWYDVEEARILPGCVQQPRVPLAIAANGPKALRVAAQYGDAWITFGEAAPGHVRVLDEACHELGRDPGEVARIYMCDNTGERPLASLDAFDDFVGRHQAMGFTDLVFHFPRADDEVWDDPPEMVEAIAERHLSGRDSA